MSFGFADALEIGKLAFQLWQKVLVARKAPQEFRTLANDLVLFQDVLHNLREDISSHRSHPKHIGDSRKKEIDRTMQATYVTLKDLESFVESFDSLRMSNGHHVRKRIGWAIKQGDIEKFRAKITAHTCSMSYWMSSMGNAKLINIGKQIEAALDTYGDARRAGTGSAPGNAQILVGNRQFQIAAQPPIQEERRFSEGSTVPEDSYGNTNNELLKAVDMDRQPSLTSTVLTASTEDCSLDIATYISTAETSPDIENPEIVRVPSHSSRRPRPSDASTNSHLLLLNEAFNSKPPSPPKRRNTEFSDSLIDYDPDPPERISNSSLLAQNYLRKAIEEARSLLAEPKETVPTKPVTLSRIDAPEDYLNEKLRDEFKEFAKDLPPGPCGRATCANDWLRAATWWLCKSRTIISLHSARLSNESMVSSNSQHLSLRQAEVDLRKAAWIVYEVVLENKDMIKQLTDSESKQIYTLDDAIKEDLDTLPLTEIDDSQLRRQNLRIWEDLQPTEQQLAVDMDDLLPPHLDPRRWLTVREEDAGDEDEGVLFRAFVNAEIGPKDVRMKTKGAPYMLLLSTKYGDSEAKITLCNQSGSLNLCRDFCRDDLRQSSENTSGDNCPTQMSIEFHGMKVSIGFLRALDFEEFMATPRRFFKAVQDRNQRSENEVLIYQTVLDHYEPLNPLNARGLIDSEVLHSCDLRLYETSGEEGWQATRRLVISSSVRDEANPRCISYFLPISFVQVCFEESSPEVMVKWSDCCHRNKKSNGSYNHLFTYEYKETEPNQCVALSFNSAEDANKFQSVLLSLHQSETSHKTSYDWTSPFESRSIYNLYDKSGSDSAPSKYRTVVVTNRRNKWHYSDVFHVPRILDFDLSDSGRTVQFNLVHRTNYLSTHIEKLYDVPPESPPEFAKCEKKLATVKLSCECVEPDMQDLMKHLTGWTLKCSRAPVRVSYKNSASTFALRRNIEKRETATISLWERRRRTSTLPPASAYPHTRSSSHHSLNHAQFYNSSNIPASISANSSSVHHQIDTEIEKRVVVRWRKDEVENHWLTAAVSPRTFLNLPVTPFGSTKGVIETEGIVRGKLLDVSEMVAVSDKERDRERDREGSGRSVDGGITVEFANSTDKEKFAQASDIHFS